MLVLSRKRTESIVIGDDITIKVIRINGGRVRLAIDAPSHIRVSRGELFETTISPAIEASDETEIRELQIVP